MPSLFNPRSFMRQVPKALLENFFSQFPVFSGFDWSQVSERRIDPAFNQMEALAPPDRDRVLQIFRQVHSLANSHGTAVLIESARDQNLEIADAIGRRENAHARALWCYMEHSQVFENARTLAHIDALPKKSWETRNGLPRQAIQVTQAAMDELGRSVGEFYRRTQARGEHCTVEYRRRDGNIHSFFVYPSDYVDQRREYDENGRLTRTRSNPPFEVVFNCDPPAGTVHMFAPGGKPVRDHLSHMFARVVLGVDQQPKPGLRAAFNLEMFKNPSITFPTDPAHDISAVQVLGMRLQFPKGERIAVKADGRRNDASVYIAIADRLNQQDARLSDAIILGVTLRAIVRTGEGKRRSLRFGISVPSTCDLQDSTEEQCLRGYFTLWGIENDA